MKCTILAGEGFCQDRNLRLFVARRLCKPGSVFQQRLFDEAPLDGFIALVEDFGETIGWARTEPWREDSDDSWRAGVLASHWNTLEAFVARDYRDRGIATFAASGLRSVAFLEDPSVAVFHPHMMLLAKKVGLLPTLFRGQGKGWVRA